MCVVVVAFCQDEETGGNLRTTKTPTNKDAGAEEQKGTISSTTMQEPSKTCSSPKRVAGGVGLVVKKRKRSRPASSVVSSASRGSASTPSILTSIPNNSRALASQTLEEPKKNSKEDDEFGDDILLNDFNDLSNDTLLCLQAYTRETSETCAYCPIFTLSNEADQTNSGIKPSNTHAAPFLPKQILLHLSANHAQTNEDIKQLAVSNKIRLLQLHGTAIARNGLGWRVNGNDDQDIAVMETCAYEIASQMALQAHFREQEKSKSIHEWFTLMLLPNFCNRTWILTSALESFIESIGRKRVQSDTTNKAAYEHRWTVTDMNEMIKELVHSGILLPRRASTLNSGEGYYFSLPGLGRAAKSIVDGRLYVLRRIQASKFKEKKRSAIEQDVGRPIQNEDLVKSGNTYVQTIKFLVLDLLARGVVYTHETCAGEQFVRIK